MAEEKAKKAHKNVGPAFIIWIIILGLAAITAFSGIYVVDETENAVITRFGKYTKTEGPGLHTKLPFGIEKNYNVDIKTIRAEQFGFKTVKSGRNNEYRNNISEESEMLTGDLNIVDVEWVIQYKVVEPKSWLFNIYERQQTIRDISRSVINTLVGDRTIFDVMSVDRSTIQNLAQEQMNNQFNSLGLGINVTTVQLQNVVPPSEVQEAFEDVNKASQDMKRLINEGKEAYNSEIPKAQGEADRQIQIAEGYAAERINMAKGDVARFNSVYEEYKRSPRVTKERIYLETMDSIFGSEKKPDLIDSELENLVPVKNLKNKE
ncbi:FtsH protease activity modulator HflK [Treponema sp. Marseille-Q3903]|uniref:FtsH protease activity modulator HflK n=1 Tax=Treponema sp. Marseille-Q3903 TaxID=2766703 RepID=UPI001652A0EC|nr:FtsH protease activity modulator HflK [Treponema sp. Marseille-Q3903]MBC6713165.1 FtsH protease activity modulator HflK [Treponema sp. Marseille-Q3903]